MSAILIALRNLVESSDGVMAGTWFHDSLDRAKEALEALDASPAPTERRIVQITEGGIEGKPGVWDADAWITGLCNDGSVWRLHGGGNAGEVWYRLPPIPQDQPNGVQS